MRTQVTPSYLIRTTGRRSSEGESLTQRQFDLFSRLSKEGLGSRILHQTARLILQNLHDHTIFYIGTAFDHLHHDNPQKSTFVFISDIAYIFWKEKTKLKWHNFPITGTQATPTA